MSVPPSRIPVEGEARQVLAIEVLSGAPPHRLTARDPRTRPCHGLALNSQVRKIGCVVAAVLVGPVEMLVIGRNACDCVLCCAISVYLVHLRLVELRPCDCDIVHLRRVELKPPDCDSRFGVSPASDCVLVAD